MKCLNRLKEVSISCFIKTMFGSTVTVDGKIEMLEYKPCLKNIL